MKRSILTVTAAAALLLGGAGAASAMPAGGPGCSMVTTPAVYKTITTPPVIVTQYEFIQRNTPEDVPGQGGGTKWDENPNWNAEGNLKSQGWTATGATRQWVADTEHSTVILVTPEAHNMVCAEPTPVPSATSPAAVPPAPATPSSPAATEPAKDVLATVPDPVLDAKLPALKPAPAVPVQAQPVAAVQEEELAYTGYSADALLWALSGLAGGGVLILAARKLGTK